MDKDYNSRRNHLIMPEYGRNIQKMVQHAMTIEDRDERNRCARTIISIMGNLFPYLRDTADFKHKLWDHLAIMSEFKLDIDSPYETPEPETFTRHPDKMPYDNHEIRFRHYGHIVEDIVQKAVSIENPEEKRHVVEDIANYMKKSLIASNKDFATDERLFNDIKTLSNGRLIVEEGTKTAFFRDPNAPVNNRNNGFQRRKNNNKGRNNYNQKNRKRY
ncbi:MAG: DUF4290 domain-containing protein [Bacteroidales bacterium]|nr:DUF4290 domain-containing protein [Bacteroidales bacterium]